MCTRASRLQLHDVWPYRSRSVILETAVRYGEERECAGRPKEETVIFIVPKIKVRPPRRRHRLLACSRSTSQTAVECTCIHVRRKRGMMLPRRLGIHGTRTTTTARPPDAQQCQAYLFMTFTVAQMSASMTPGGITLTKPKSCQGDKGTSTRESVRDSSLLRFVAPAARPPQRRIGALACEVHGGFRRREKARARERESGWRPREREEEKQAASV